VQVLACQVARRSGQHASVQDLGHRLPQAVLVSQLLQGETPSQYYLAADKM